MSKRPTRLACGVVLVLAVGLGTTHGTTHGASEPTQPKRPRASSGSVKVIPGSEESTAERERRLKRECRGRPNAGACLGFAS